MKIGIDISQIVYRTGVSKYLESLLKEMIKLDRKNDYVLFFSSLRKTLDPSFDKIRSDRVEIKKFKYPPTLLDFFWNKLHIFPIEKFIGDVDIFITSDWTEPPTKKAKKASIIYDLTVFLTPEEMDKKIISTQKKKLKWLKKESNFVFTISESSKKDINEILGIPMDKIKVIYPGYDNRN